MISRAGWQRTVWRQRTRSAAASSARCATREINAAAGLRPRRDFARVQSIRLCSRAALCLPPTSVSAGVPEIAPSVPFEWPPPARARLELLLRGHTRAPAHTCLVRPHADLFPLARSSRSRCPSKNRGLTVHSGPLGTLFAHVERVWDRNIYIYFF